MRRQTVVGILGLSVGLLATASVAAQETIWPGERWATSTAADQGLDETPLRRLHRDIQAGAFGYVDRMIVVRNGYLVLSERYENDYRTISRGRQGPLGCGADTCASNSELHDFNYYHPDFHPYYQGRDIHSLQSVTKSVSSIMIGIAIHRGEITGVDAPLLSFFEAYDLSHVDRRLRDATLEDLLTMRTGIEWHESDRPLGDENTTIQLEKSADWIQFTLDQPSDAAPGEKWVYNSGGSHLMSGVVRQATGQFIDAYAREHLFGPIGVHDSYWKKTPRGFPDTEGGLYLEAEDLARIAYLYLRGGVWDGRRIVPEGWVAASTARQAQAGGNRGYGYQWWRLDRGGVDIWAGLGFGGQYLIVMPEFDIVGVVNSWNLFGGQHRNILSVFIDGLIASAQAID